MEIRRKVFSLLQDENGEERYYSTNEFEISYDEETGEKMFSEKEDKKMSTGAKVALGVAGTAAATVAALEGGNALKKVITKANVKKIANASDEALKKAAEAMSKNSKRYAGDAENALRALKAERTAARKKLTDGFKGEGIEFVEKANQAVAEAYKGAKEGVRRIYGKAKTKTEEVVEKGRDAIKTAEIESANAKNVKYNKKHNGRATNGQFERRKPELPARQ